MVSEPCVFTHGLAMKACVFQGRMGSEASQAVKSNAWRCRAEELKDSEASQYLRMCPAVHIGPIVRLPCEALPNLHKLLQRTFTSPTSQVPGGAKAPLSGPAPNGEGEASKIVSSLL